MDATELAQVLRAGPAALAGLAEASMNRLTAAQALGIAVAGMAAEAEAISRRGLADPPAPGWHRYHQPPDAPEQPPDPGPPDPGHYWVIDVYYHGTTPVVGWWTGSNWVLMGYSTDNYVTWWAPIPPPTFGEAETSG
jgi:hypothetical protein